ncbi:alpha/beta fold hydrolase [Rubinisphaera margarita]|uniref:alpha/beta fold hydrolase n=1 Tax=Rubinisphaera margarita TaxID=2909586 RepID=UPI001EE8A003|nr:alpha/beta fold hydrolase [Rubinisphaera margarita]MCG6157211.1 alpha/beta fold hydrolase [Rubinisphaera margarita]
MTDNQTSLTDQDVHPAISKAGLADEYPFASRFLQTEFGNIHYIDEGQGPVLLFVHGNPTWSFAWRNLIKQLSPEYRCVAIDHLGCGLSDKPQLRAYHLSQHVDRLQKLIESLQLRNITLIAHDWGGAIGCGAAGRTPDQFSRLVLMNTAAFRSKRIPLRIAVCRTPLLGTVGVRGLNLFAGAAVRMAVNEASPLPERIKKGYLLPYESWNDRIAVDKFVKDIPLRPTHPSYRALVEIEENLERLKGKPMLLPWGMKDWCFTPHFLREFQTRFPSAQAVEFPTAGHYLFEERPDDLTAAIRQFLDQNS